MTVFADAHPERTLSVTAAAGRGVAGLVKDAERGEDIIRERHGRPVAAVVSIDHLDELRASGPTLRARPGSRPESSPTPGAAPTSMTPSRRSD